MASNTCDWCGGSWSGTPIIDKDGFFTVKYFCCEKCRQEWRRSKGK